MWLETMIAWTKTLPHWLMVTVEILIVATVFMTAITFLAGIWCGMKIIGNKVYAKVEIQLIPPKITFNNHDIKNKE